MPHVKAFGPALTSIWQAPTWKLTINDTDPIFYYCSAPTSCIESAMVGVINPVGIHQ